MKTNICKIECYGQPVAITAGEYRNGNLAIVATDEDGQPCATVSVNLPGTNLAQDEFCAKFWSENEPFRTPLLASGKFVDTGRRVPTGFVCAEVWRLAS